MRTLVGLAASCVVIAALHAAQELVLPLVLALFLSMLTHPLVAWLKRRKVPVPLGVTLVVLLAIVVLGLVTLLAVESLTNLGELLPAYQARFRTLALGAGAWLRAHGLPLPSRALLDGPSPATLLEGLATAAGSAAGLLAQLALVMVVMVFMLLEASALERKLDALPAPIRQRLEQLTAGGAELQRYLLTKTAISILSGLVVGIWLWALGLELPLLWGLLAFAFNFIPNIGSFIAAAPALLLALLSGDTGLLLGTLSCYAVVDLGIGNILEPLVMGRQMGLSSLTVILSLVFWGWIFGPLGMFLSVPLTMSAKVLLGSGDQAWLAQVLEAPPPSLLGGARRRTSRQKE